LPHECTSAHGDLVCVKVPAMSQRHCVDLHAWRSSRGRLASLVNSSLFSGALRRALTDLGIGEYLDLDRLPAGVTADTTGFLAVITIQIGEK
jgi:hypothetical protein